MIYLVRAWRPWRRPRRQDEREDVVSDSEGRVVFNYLQQHEQGFDDPPMIPASRVPTTTDPFGIVDE